ncbi:MAG: Peptidase C60 sortase A and B [Candidatus Woesebacteria bacterium GW2011_GWB1_45_5]|uniref:Peptidase C60 sortase A and B n=1 Tax=Candidatus Woesebacteria bacterium GW2011_GWB1_45_5 TaxID=1618581 RepID=A0A0G1MQ33_9BACT|nr:MAG: Peptidase C60 sortase A and B [Candidatus Woesebacteria bacterium GW2011_GWB1_45_5]
MASLLSRVLKTSRKHIKRLNQRPLLLLFLGLFIFFVGASNYYRVRILSFNNAPSGAVVSADDPPVQITIPSIDIDIPVEPASIKDGVWEISYKNATFLNTSGTPESGGNIVVYGHNKKAIFGNLPYLSLGQKIIVKTQNGKTYEYEAYQKDFVGPDRVDLVSPTTYEELTIYTCWGLFDSQRVVIKAKPVL